MIAMIRRFIGIAIALPSVALFCSTAALAQAGPMEGTVRVKSESGQPVPVAGAVVEIVRTDIKGRWEVKTDKNGHYVYLGLPIIGTFVVIASGPGMQPTWLNNVRIAQNSVVDILAERGDGSRLSADQVQAAIKGGAGAAPQANAASDKAKAEAV